MIGREKEHIMARADQPVDLHYLDRFTGGNRAINEEILRLFDNQCRESLALLEVLAHEGGDAKSWREITHTLKGAARGIGAFDLGDAVADVENSAPASAQPQLERLKRDAAAVFGFIAKFLQTQT
jgi:HPt (histidine-containing phosphotransfer) domain-containing protein